MDGTAVKNLLPSSKLAEALNFVHNYWEALKVFASDGRLTIDNKQSERMKYQVAVGRKERAICS